MIPIEMQVLRPYIAFAIGMISDYLIARGYLMPEQRQLWVEGWIQIISAVSAGLLSVVLLWHEFKVLHNKTTKTIVETTENLPRVTTVADPSPETDIPQPTKIRDLI
jgi:hypothetical protein